jgi:uncharacterized secreted protein with C-terminal beta-propeller domain
MTPLGTQDVGLKVSLFDISDPANPLELDKLLLGEGYTEAEYNPRALTVDAARALFAFPADIYGDSQSWQSWSGGIVVGVEDRALTLRAQLKANTAAEQQNSQRRLCYIGDTLYMAGAVTVTAYDYNDFAYQSILELPATEKAFGKEGVIID